MNNDGESSHVLLVQRSTYIAIILCAVKTLQGFTEDFLLGGILLWLDRV